MNLLKPRPEPKSSPKLLAKWRRASVRNKEKKKAARLLWRAKNLQHVRRVNSKWQSDNWAYRQQYTKEYQKKNRERLKAQRHAHYLANKAEILRKSKIYQQSHPEMNRKRGQVQRDNHPGRYSAYAQKRRALKKAATINLESIQKWIESVRVKPSAICYWCQSRIASNAIHFDHIVPLSKGGAHSVENLCVSCGPCNQSKNNKSIRTWAKINQTFLEL